MRRSVLLSTSLVVVLLLASCSYFPTTENDYKKSRSMAPLKPAAGVVIPKADRTYRVPELENDDSDAVVEEPAPVPPAKKIQAVAARKPAAKAAIAMPVAAAGTAVKSKAMATPPTSAKSGKTPIFVTRQDLTRRMEVKKPSPASGKPTTAAKKVATESNSFELVAPPEKVWPRLVAYWMHRGIPLVESNPETGKILTDWIPSTDPAAGKKGVRDQFQITLARSKRGSRVTLVHRASRKTTVKGGRSEWTLLGSEPALQGTETVRLRSYLTGK